MSNMTLTMMGVFALAAMPAFAQSSTTSSGQASGSGSSMSGQSSGTSEKTKSDHSGQAMSTSALSAADKKFVREAAQGGLAEVEMGKLASQKGSNSDVKSFGQMMVDDHTKANDELKSLASSKGVTVPSDLDAKDKAEVSRLEKLSGEQFDRAYMQAMTRDHKKDIAEFKRESTSGKDTELKDWAGKTLPTLEKHLQHAEQTASAVGASGATASSAAGKAGSKSHKTSGTNTGGRK